MGLEKEGGCVGHGHMEVVSVCTSYKEVMHNLLTTIGEISCRSGQFGVFLIKVHQNKPSVKEGYSSHHLFKLPGLLLFAQKGGSGSAGRGQAGLGQLAFLWLLLGHLQSWVLCAKKTMVSF